MRKVWQNLTILVIFTGFLFVANTANSSQWDFGLDEKHIALKCTDPTTGSPISVVYDVYGALLVLAFKDGEKPMSVSVTKSDEGFLIEKGHVIFAGGLSILENGNYLINIQKIILDRSGEMVKPVLSPIVGPLEVECK